MLRYEEEAIVLDAQSAGETHKRIWLLTEHGERVHLWAPGAARSKRRFSGALQPAAKVAARWTLKKDGALPILEEAELLVPPPKPDPLDRFYVACHLLEIVGAFAKEGMEDPRLYRLLGKSLLLLQEGKDVDLIARYAEAWTLRLSGWLPEIERCVTCGVSLHGAAAEVTLAGGALCVEHGVGSRLRLRSQSAEWLRATRRREPEALERPEPAENHELSTVLLAVIVDAMDRPLRCWPALARWRRKQYPS